MLAAGTEKHFSEALSNNQLHDKGSQTLPHPAGKINGECKSRDLRNWKTRESQESSRHPRVGFYMQGEESCNMKDMHIHEYTWSSASDFYEGLNRFENVPVNKDRHQDTAQETPADIRESNFPVLRRIMIPAVCTTDTRYATVHIFHWFSHTHTHTQLHVSHAQGCEEHDTLCIHQHGGRCERKG